MKPLVAVVIVSVGLALQLGLLIAGIRLHRTEVAE